MKVSIPSLLSFRGRLRRSHFWVTNLAVLIVGAVLKVILSAATGQSLMSGGGHGGSLIDILFLWPTLALLVKRGHDRNRSARISLLLVVGFLAGSLGSAAAMGMGVPALATASAVVAFASLIFLLVDYGFLDGTKGPNRFGSSPKGVGGEVQDVAEAFD